MSSRAQELEAMARECRELAAKVQHPEVREQLLETADQFERLARYQRSRQNGKRPFEIGTLKCRV